MRTDVPAVDETVGIEDPVAQPDSNFLRPGLREAKAPAASAEDDLREIRKGHLAFKQVGRTKETDLPAVDGRIPLALYPYVDIDRLRGDYPVCLFSDPKTGILALSEVVDQAIAGLEMEGDDLERCRRWSMQLEMLIRSRFSEDTESSLFKLWNAGSEQLSGHYKDDPEKQEKLHRDLAAVRKNIPSDAELVGCQQSTAQSILHTLWRQTETVGKNESVRSIENVVGKLNDLLALDSEESDSGLAPDHLKESVGEAFQSALNFDALSSLLHDAPHGESLSASRKKRIKTIVKILSSHLDALGGRLHEMVHILDSLEIPGHIQRLLNEESAVTRAWTAARLETTARFDEKRHQALLSEEASMRWGQSAPLPNPLPPIHLDLKRSFNSVDAGVLGELFDRRIPVRVLVTVQDCVVGGSVDDSEPYLPISPAERLLLTGHAAGFLAQTCLSDIEGLLSSMKAFLRSETTAVLIVYEGSEFGTDVLHPYLKSAAGKESRVFPSLRNDVDAGPTWAARFAIDRNEQLDRTWPETAVEFATGAESTGTRTCSFGAAEFMACDPRFSDHFGVVEPREWNDDLVSIKKYAGEAHLVPFVELASEDGVIHRVIASDYVWEQSIRVAERWSSLKELAGVSNSFALRAVEDEKVRLAAEYQEKSKKLESEHKSALEATTGKLAQEIVANIAAGLLGEATAGPTPVQVRSVAKAVPVQIQQDDDVSDVETVVEEPPVEEEEDLEVFDEAYIESPRCTACDECTVLNPRLFLYNENKQAYIADASAGTFRELVLAAEKCPVRIIHPGKPLNPDEPHLEELVKRAEPFR